MTSEDISNLTNSISNLSLSKEVTESENSDDEPMIIAKLFQKSFIIILAHNYGIMH